MTLFPIPAIDQSLHFLTVSNPLVSQDMTTSPFPDILSMVNTLASPAIAEASQYITMVIPLLLCVSYHTCTPFSAFL